jgi:5-methylcytosine-specific restriction endonuclease McrA
MVSVHCIICKKEFQVTPSRVSTARYCSNACRGKGRTLYWSGENWPLYQKGSRATLCQHCGKEFAQRGTEAISEFRKRKFCSMECAKYGQTRLYGKAHPLFKEDSRRKNRRGKHGAWARAVISRDNATCQQCGATEVELHAHHIKPFETHPALRWDINNGQTLCYRCHWAEHTALNANGVNSGNSLPGQAEANPEPSFGRKPVEGVTTRGRAYRRWNGNCDWCGAFISKRWSDTTGKPFLFCSGSCRSKHIQWKLKRQRR